MESKFLICANLGDGRYAERVLDEIVDVVLQSRGRAETVDEFVSAEREVRSHIHSVIQHTHQQRTLWLIVRLKDK